MTLVYIVIICILIYFTIVTINNIRVKIILNNPKVQSMIRVVQCFLVNIDEYKKIYFTNSLKEEIKENYRALYDKLNCGEFKNIVTDETKNLLRYIIN